MMGNSVNLCDSQWLGSNEFKASTAVKNIFNKIKLMKLGLNFTSNASSSTCCNNYGNVSNNSLSDLADKWIPRYYDKMEENATLLKATVIFFYALIVFVSFFGNIIVCKIVFTGSGKKSTTNLYIGNLSISDLMMTIINIPLQLTEVLRPNWPLGVFLCKCLSSFGGMSVAISTLTMAFIALDRYRVIAHPLKPRPSYKTTIHKLVFIWIIALILSIPYSLMSQVTTCYRSYDFQTRCIINYPSPNYIYRQIFTLISLILQFAAPLTVSAILYVKICFIIWKRKSIGAVTLDQQIYQREAKWKTIKMLIIVLITFVVCWLPLNIYHTYQDSRGETDFKKHNSVVWLVCHWFAMSSVCCNPFIYCWLNDKFRKAAKSHLKWIQNCSRINSQKPMLRVLGGNNKMRLTVTTDTNSSLKFSTFSSQSKEFPSVAYEKQLPTTKHDEDSKQTFNHAVAKTVENTLSNAKHSSKKYLIEKHDSSQQKKYKNSTASKSFV